MAALSYMQRRASGIYEFRRRLPQTLAGKPCPAHVRSALAELINPATGCFKRELTVSLKTTDTAAAKRLDMREAVRVADLMHLAERMLSGGVRAEVAGVPAVTPQEIEADIVSSVLRADEEEREVGDARRYLQTPTERLQWPDLADPGFHSLGLAEGHLELLDDHIGELRDEYRKALAARRPEIVRAETNAYLKARSIPIDPASPFYREAGMAVLRAHVKAFGMLAARQEGDDIPTPAPSVGRGPKLSEAYAVWKAGSIARGGRIVAPKTIREADRSVRLFLQWHGDMRLRDITKEAAQSFRDAIARIPRGLDGAERKLTLKALLESDLSGRPAAHAGTVNKHLNLLSAIVSHAAGENAKTFGANFANPFKGVGYTLDKRHVRRERYFTGAELSAIFSTGVYTRSDRPDGGKGEAAFWLPLMALLTGARQGELAQLRVTDLKQDVDTGIWFIDIGTEGGRSIKTAASRREVPIHSELLRLGLLDYRAAIAKADPRAEASLWPGLAGGDKFNVASAWSKWFNRYLNEAAGLTDPDLVFHTFRSTFKRFCRDAGLSQEQHDSLTGHTGIGGVSRSYAAGFGLKALDGFIARIEAPKAVRDLRVWA